MRTALAELSEVERFDYVVVNDDFGSALDALADVVQGRGQPSRADRPELAPVVAALLA